MKICFVDSYYPDFLKTLTLGNGTYQEELDKVLARQFGTADFYSREFRKLGHECIDIIANYPELQKRWGATRETDTPRDIVLYQIWNFKADVVFVQDLSFFSDSALALLQKSGIMLVAQCSCEINNELPVGRFHTIFTSFPHYIPKLKALGVNAVYMPLAFHESVLKPPVERDIDVSFVGGIGWQWKQGLEVLEAVAREIPTFQWWGYGAEQLKAGSPLSRCYKGTAWGDEMYAIYQRSKVVLNRHGEIAEGYAQNMRMYEAAGCGAALVTDNDPGDNFPLHEIAVYDSPADAVRRIRLLLSAVDLREKMARWAQERTLTHHTYAHRVPKIAEVLQNAMASA